jgi:hypothetical protein
MLREVNQSPRINWMGRASFDVEQNEACDREGGHSYAIPGAAEHRG